MVYPTYWLAVSWICLCFKSKWAVSFRFVSQGIYLFHFLLLKKEWPSSTNHPPFFTCLFIYLSRASYCWRVNQKRRPFKKYDHSHSSYTMPEQTWNILSVFIDFWENPQWTVPHFTVGWSAVMWNITFFHWLVIDYDPQPVKLNRVWCCRC